MRGKYGSLKCREFVAGQKCGITCKVWGAGRRSTSLVVRQVCLRRASLITVEILNYSKKVLLIKSEKNILNSTSSTKIYNIF